VGNAAQNVRVVGRYALYGAIAAGGMATVHLGRLLGPVGFSRTVAIKRLHAQFASDPEFVSMFLDEARLAARIRHPNVVPTLDVVATGGELFLVMEYVPGESIARLSRVLRERQETLPTRILSAVMAGVLHGLHAAHEAKDERGIPLGIVHRDMSPQNVLLGTDGVARVLDFGVAKAAGRMQTTREGQIKGKLSYMPPEQLRGASVNRQSDIYAAGVMLWELVTGQRLFAGDNEGAIVAKVLDGRVEAPSKVLMRGLNPAHTLDSATLLALESVDSTILRALASEPSARFATAREMAIEIERKLPPATGSEVTDWLEAIAKDVLSSRAAMVAEIESSTSHVAVEPHEGHVQSVLQAKSTLGPSQAASFLAQRHRSDSAPPTVSQHRELPASQTMSMAGGPPVARPSYHGPLDGPPVTQPSSISVASGSHGGRAHDVDPSSGRRTTIAALVGVMLGASVLASALVYRYTISKSKVIADGALVLDAGYGGVAPGLTATPPSTAAAPNVVANVADAATAAPSAEPGAVAALNGIATAAPGTTGSVTAAAVTSKPPIKRPPTAAPVKTQAPVAATPPPTAAPDCTTPVWFDAQGVKHYKPQCLDK
jgi:serine/threonine protein kinase